MKCLLFALTGMGNGVLTSLASSSLVSDILVVTRQEKGPFPHYACPPIQQVCAEVGVRSATCVLADSDGQALVEGYEPDLILCATFDQFIPGNVRRRAPLGAFNIHPSLLPDLRGPTPTNWAIILGRKETGVTFHVLEDVLDAGAILRQKSMEVGEMTDGELRQALATLAAEETIPFLDDVANGRLVGVEQDESEAVSLPKVLSEEGKDIIRKGEFPLNRTLRGVTPYPGESRMKDILHGLH